MKHHKSKIEILSALPKGNFISLPSYTTERIEYDLEYNIASDMWGLCKSI